jgi:hypothetical protein
VGEQGPDEAVACYRRALDLDPTIALAHGNRGATLAKRGRFDEQRPPWPAFWAEVAALRTGAGAAPKQLVSQPTPPREK